MRSMTEKPPMPHRGSGVPTNASTTEELACECSTGPWLVEVGGLGAPIRRVLGPGERLVLGSGLAADLRIEDPWVSQQHCVLEHTENRVRVHDLDSKNGVFVGAARVKSAGFSARTGGFVIGRTAVIVKSQMGYREPPRSACLPGLVGNSEPMQRVAEQVMRVAPRRAPVLLLGESGVGKDVVARALHLLSKRDGEYVPLNVGTIPDTLADSELFGHVRGAFTGAVAQHKGAFESAHRGTLFLDEIGEVSPSVQVRLLRVLEDGVVRPVGASATKSVDVRVVSATWAPLLEHCAKGRFRFDLFQRLSTVVISIPALRERRSDIPCLVNHWLCRIHDEVGSKTLTSAALSRLVAHDWPGNVRELGSVIYRAAIMVDGPSIDLMHVELALGARGGEQHSKISEPERMLAKARGNVSLAARLAGVPRSTFRAWLAREKSPECVEEDGA